MQYNYECNGQFYIIVELVGQLALVDYIMHKM